MITLRRLGFATALALTATAAPSIPVAAATTPVSGMFVLATGRPALIRRTASTSSRSSSPVTSKAAGTPTSTGPGISGPQRALFRGRPRGVRRAVPRWPRRDFLVDLQVRMQMGPRFHERGRGGLGTVPAPDRPRQRHRRVAGCHRSPRSHRRRHRRHQRRQHRPLSRLPPPAVTTTSRRRKLSRRSWTMLRIVHERRVDRAHEPVDNRTQAADPDPGTSGGVHVRTVA